jgi:Fibronectin type III domain/Pentapeptide repeats (8 copies)
MRSSMPLRVVAFVLVAATFVALVVTVPASARTPRIKAPSAPTGVHAAPIDGGTAVSWSAPVSDGGSPITGYTVTAEDSHGCTTTGALSCTVTGLRNGKSYFVKVRASNVVRLGKVARVSVVPGQGPNCGNLSPGANLQYCNYKEANLSGVDLAGANLFGARLFRTNLQNADLAGANMISSEMAYANLAGVDLTAANLTSADLTGATLTGVTWSNTTCPDGTNSSSYSPQTCVGHGI